MAWYFSRKEQVAVAVLLLAIVGALLVLSYACGRRDRQSAREPFFTPGEPVAAVATTPEGTADAPVLVHIAGAVNKPGVYNLAGGARVNDAIHQAGGARSDGYPDALNLAEKLKDGEKITVPTKAEWERSRASLPPTPLVQTGADAHSPVSSTHAASSGDGEASSADRGPKPLPTEKVALNTATLEQLMTLPGIGPVSAQKILDYRAAHGKFTDLSQLLEVPKIGPKTLDRLKPYLTL